jgi:hypothetical protein
MDQTEPHAAHIAALEQRQRWLTRQVRGLLIIVVLLTALTCWQQWQSYWLLTQHEGLVNLLQQMELFREPAVHREPPTTL